MSETPKEEQVDMQFSMKHSDPLLWGKCQCEPCWVEREAAADRVMVNRQKDREHRMELHKRRAELAQDLVERVRQSDFWCVMFFMLTVPTVGAFLWAFCNVVYWFLRSRGW